MPSKKKKYNARFPAGRIKKIMQTDEEVGKVAQAVPVIILISCLRVLERLKTKSFRRLDPEAAKIREVFLFRCYEGDTGQTLELFVHSLLTKTMQITNAKNAKTLSPSHMKQCILSESRFDFLKDLVKGLPDVSGPDEDVPTPPLTPALMSVNPLTTPCAHSMKSSDPEFQHEKNFNSTSRRSSKDCKVTGIANLSQTTNVSTSNVPEFQMSVPTSFGMSQPNFYMEVSPLNLATNPTRISGTNQAISNFNHTANIDEDYDT